MTKTLSKQAKELSPYLVPLIEQVAKGFGSSAASSGSSVTAPNATYVVVSNTSDLTNERALNEGSGISLTDQGANSTLDVAIDYTISPTWTGTHTFNNAILLPDGTTGAPSIGFSDDTNTGIYSPSNGTVAVVTDGSARTTFTGVANVLQVNSATYNNVASFSSTDNLAVLTLADDDTTAYINAEGGYLSMGNFAQYSTGNLSVELSTGYIGLGVAPAAPVTVQNTSTQMRLMYDGSNYNNLASNSSGMMVLSGAGSQGGYLYLYGDLYVGGNQTDAITYVGSSIAGRTARLRLYAANAGYFDWYAHTDGHLYNYLHGNVVVQLDSGGAFTFMDNAFTTNVWKLFETYIYCDVEISSTDYVSQTTGWHITEPGAADFRSIYADELHVQAFIADIYQALVGAIIVTKSRGRLSRDFTVPVGDEITSIDGDVSAASITGIDGDVSGAAITAVDTTNDYFSIAGDQTSLISQNDRFQVAGSTGNNGTWVVDSVSYDTNTDIYVTGDITDATVDGNITFFHYFSIAGDQTSNIAVNEAFKVAGSTGNDNDYIVASVSYDGVDTETDIYATNPIPHVTADGNITLLHYFSIDGNRTTDYTATETIYVNGTTGNDGTYTIDSVSYDGTDTETDIYVTSGNLIASSTADGGLGKSGTLYIEDLEGWEDTQVFAADDTVRLRVVDTSGGGLVVTDVWGSVNNYTNLTGGEQSWTWETIDDGGVDGNVIYTGSIALDYGQRTTGSKGVWEATVLDTAGAPYSQVKTWSTEPWESGDWTVNTRVGNLDGITGIGLEYGLWAGEGTGDTDGQVIVSSGQATFKNIDFTIHDGSNVVFKIDRTTPYLSMGSTAPTTYLTGTGLWVGYDTTTYKMHLGNPAGAHLYFDGTDLGITGEFSAVDGLVTINNDALVLDKFGYAIQWYDGTDQTMGIYGWESGDYTGATFYNTRYVDISTGTGITTVTLTNPGFETGDLTGWTDDDYNGTSQAVASSPRTGTYCLQMYSNQDTIETYYAQVYSSNYTGAEGDIANFTFWYKSTGVNTGGGLTVYIEWLNSGSSVIQTDTVYRDLASGSRAVSTWTEIAVRSKRAPANTSYVRMKLYVGSFGATHTATFWFDDLELETIDSDTGIRIGYETVDVLGDLWTESDVDVTGDLQVTGEIQQGSTDYGAYEIQTNGQIYANDYGVFMGGVHVGGTSDPGTDNLIVDGDAFVVSGLFVGSQTNPNDNDIAYDGNLQSYKSSTFHDVYAFRPYTTPRTNTDFDGDSFSTTGTHTKIENTGWVNSPGVPSDAKAINLRIRVRDSATVNSDTTLYFAIHATSTGNSVAVARPIGGDFFTDFVAAVPCTDGDIWYTCNASGTNTMDVWLEVTGYWI